MNRIIMALLAALVIGIGVAGMSHSVSAEPSENAVAHANPNANFLRCGGEPCGQVNAPGKALGHAENRVTLTRTEADGSVTTISRPEPAVKAALGQGFVVVVAP